MVTVAEEEQTREFLKRAEVSTMKKDIKAFREADALRERDKIAKIKTIEELEEDQRKKLAEQEQAKNEAEQAEIKEILHRNEAQEEMAEKDLKKYATEQERQQIFLLESQRLSFEKQIDAIDKEKIPELKLEKNKLLGPRNTIQSQLKSVLEQQKKLEGEQGLVAQKAKTSAIDSERKALEERKWELDKEIQEIEKKSWVLENQLKEADGKIDQLGGHSEQLVLEKDKLRDKISGLEKSLRDIYAGVVERVEETRRGEATEQRTQRASLSKLREEDKEKIQRAQWSRIAVPKRKDFLRSAPTGFKEELARSTAVEEKERAKFLHDVQAWSETKSQPAIVKQRTEKRAIEIPVPRKK
jgi:hypothetical protein